MRDFHVKGRLVPNPVDKQKLADARFDLRFQAILYGMVSKFTYNV